LLRWKWVWKVGFKARQNNKNTSLNDCTTLKPEEDGYYCALFTCSGDRYHDKGDEGAIQYIDAIL